MPFRSILLVAVLGAPVGSFVPNEVDAQQRSAAGDPRDGVRVSGHVVDRTTGVDLSSARLVFTPRDPDREGRWEQLTDSAGRFAIEWLPLGTYDLHVEALAFLELTRPVTFAAAGAADVRVEMVPDALELEPIVVTATRLAWLADVGFYERRARGLGYSLAREEIEARNPYLVSDIFYGIPGADVISERTGRTPAFVLLRGRCVPQVVLDGAPFSGPIPVDQVASVAELEAIEVYHGSTGPVRYSSSSCGTIMLWTKRATADGGRPLTWKRFLAAAGIVAWFAFAAW
jgi:hypothetical protein